MRCLVHIGPPKTGSTSIQRALFQNRQALLDAGMHFLANGPGNEWRLLIPFMRRTSPNWMPRPLRLLFRDSRGALEWSEKGWDILRAQAAKPEIDTIIISSEHLINIPDKAGFVARLEENFDEIHLVGYLRDPVKLFVS